MDEQKHFFKIRIWPDLNTAYVAAPWDYRATLAYIQRRGSISAWIVILSVYAADKIAEVRLLISPFLLWSLNLWNQLLGFSTILIYMQ